jgi:hypothetical protein
MPESEKTQIDPNVIIGTQQAVLQSIKDYLGVNRGLDIAAQTIVLSSDSPGLQTTIVKEDEQVLQTRNR